MIRDALAALRARRGRTLLAALGVLAASLVVGTATTVGYSLATGFDRAADRPTCPTCSRASTRDERDAGRRARERAAEPAGPVLPRERLNQLLEGGLAADAQGRRHRACWAGGAAT